MSRHLGDWGGTSLTGNNANGGTTEIARRAKVISQVFHRDWIGYNGVLVVPFMAIASLVAIKVCRHVGVSRDHVQTEVLAFASTDSSVDPIEVRSDPGVWKLLAWVCFGFFIVVLLLLRFVPSVPGTEIWGYVLAAGALGLAAFFWFAGDRKLGFVAITDASGFTCSRVFGVQRVPWKNVAHIAISEHYRALGELERIVIELKGDGNTVLARCLMLGRPRDEARRFIDHLRHRCSAISDAATSIHP